MEKFLFIITAIVLQSYFNLDSDNFIPGGNVDLITFEPLKIDQFDTVFFDLNKANILNDKYIDVPVYIKSDDDIFSLDFSFKFNNGRLLYDTILDHTGYIQFTEYLNPVDATVRFTSNSFTKYKKDTFKIVSVRFSFSSIKIESTDLNSIMVYLNGESCSVKVIGMKNTTPNSFDIIEEDRELVRLFPNPVKDAITFSTEQKCTIEIYGLNCSYSLASFTLWPDQNYTIPVSHLPQGIYFARVKTKSKEFSRRIVIQ